MKRHVNWLRKSHWNMRVHYMITKTTFPWLYAKSCKSSALAIELHLYCIKPSICCQPTIVIFEYSFIATITFSLCYPFVGQAVTQWQQVMDCNNTAILTHLPLDKMDAILADDNFKCIFLNENDRIPIRISLKFVPRSPIDNIPALVQIMAWHRPGDKPLSEPILTHFTNAYNIIDPSIVYAVKIHTSCT